MGAGLSRAGGGGRARQQEMRSISRATLNEFSFQNLFQEIAIRVSVEIFAASFGVFCLYVCLFKHSLVCVAHNRILPNPQQAGADTACVLCPG